MWTLWVFTCMHSYVSPMLYIASGHKPSTKKPFSTSFISFQHSNYVMSIRLLFFLRWSRLFFLRWSQRCWPNRVLHNRRFHRWARFLRLNHRAGRCEVKDQSSTKSQIILSPKWYQEVHMEGSWSYPWATHGQLLLYTSCLHQRNVS